MSEHTPALVDVVATAQEAATLAFPPLLVLGPVADVLDEAGLGSGPLLATRIGGGHSNVTFLVERDDWHGVLRRPPRPPYQQKAHDMLREARVQRALAETPVKVPRILHVERDLTVLGVPFYVMERLDGFFVTTVVPSAHNSPAGHQALGQAFVDQLAQLHLVDPAALGLQDLGDGRAFGARQLHVFGKLWRSYRTREMPALDEVEAWLHARVPPEPKRSTLLHGDFRLANVMYSPDPPVRVRALLDWELSTIGDPVADLGYLVSTYPATVEDKGTLISEASAAGAASFPSRADLVGRYATATDLDLSSLPWWVTLAYWRTAVGLESFYRRALAGTTDDPFLQELEVGIPALAERAHEAMRGHGL